MKIKTIEQRNKVELRFVTKKVIIRSVRLIEVKHRHHWIPSLWYRGLLFKCPEFDSRLHSRGCAPLRSLALRKNGRPVPTSGLT